VRISVAEQNLSQKSLHAHRYDSDSELSTGRRKYQPNVTAVTDVRTDLFTQDLVTTWLSEIPVAIPK
jgi:hypothetical protein